MKFYLKVNDEWVCPEFNTDDEEGLSLYWTFDNLSNPVDYVGEYSYDFTLPFTNKNKSIFKNFERLDGLTDNDLTTTTVFHPNILIDYIIHTTNDVISTGQAYMSEINENGYVLSLNGTMCTAFTKLLNSGWDTAKAAADEDYYLFDDIDETLDRNLIYRMWLNDTPTFRLDPHFTDITNVLCAVPAHQGQYSDFTSNQRINNTLLFGNRYYDLPEAVNEWQMQEYRSYEQNFGIYINKLFQLYQSKCREICDYDLLLDSRWFNEYYQYLANMVYVLGRVKHTTSNDVENRGQQTNRTITLPTISTLPSSGEVAGLIGLGATMPMSNISVERGGLVEFQFEINFKYPAFSGSNTGFFLFASWANPFEIKIDFNDASGNTVYTYQSFALLYPDTVNSDGEYLFSGETQYLNGVKYIVSRYTPQQFGTNPNLTVNVADLVRFTSPVDGTLTPVVTVKYSNSTTPFVSLFNTDYATWKAYYPLNTAPTLVLTVNTMWHNVVANRSGQAFTFERVFGDTNPFTVLLKYTKMFGMYWLVDDYNKTITIKRRSDYFWDLLHINNNFKSPNENLYMGFYDISRFVDYDSFNIVPLAWDTRKVEFNYDDSDDQYLKHYKDKYKRTYGSALIVTENYLNKDTKELLCNTDNDTIRPSCIVQPYYKPYSSLSSPLAVKKKCGAAPSACTENDQQADLANCFLFRLANTTLPASMHSGNYRTDDNGMYAFISDDLPFEVENNKYCWHDAFLSQSVGDIAVRKIPNFSTVRNGYSLQFAEPYEVYFTLPLTFVRGDVQPTEDYIRRWNPTTSIKYVYDTEFAGYIQEVYSVENKTLEVNVAMNGQLYRRLKSIPLVTIDNVAYLVTEIDGWNEYNKLTKITLRQIFNYNKLMVGNRSEYAPTTGYNTIDGSEPIPLPQEHAVYIDTEEEVTGDWDEIEDKSEFVPLITEKN